LIIVKFVKELLNIFDILMINNNSYQLVFKKIKSNLKLTWYYVEPHPLLFWKKLHLWMQIGINVV